MYIIIITWSLWIRNFKQDETFFFSNNFIVKPPPFQVIFIVKTPSILCNFLVEALSVSSDFYCEDTLSFEI